MQALLLLCVVPWLAQPWLACMQVWACRSAMAGEQTVVIASVHVSHDCPAQQGTVSATYADSGEPPLLSLEQSPGNGTYPVVHCSH